MSAAAGIGLKPIHYSAIVESKPDVGFLEVHAENYMGAGGPPHRWLERLAADYPLSFHGVGLSLAGAERADRGHLHRWRELVDRYEPQLVSEHVAWSGFGGASFHDLLPVPYSFDALDALCRNIDLMQETLRRRVLIENPSRYVDFEACELTETGFLIEAARRTGCGLLIDLNNVYVSTRNLGGDAGAWISSIPADLVGEIHLAGHSIDAAGSDPLLIDDHGAPVCDAVWSLYRDAICAYGPQPTLIEWDTNVPPLATLLEEAAAATKFLRDAIRPPLDAAAS